MKKLIAFAFVFTIVLTTVTAQKRARRIKLLNCEYSTINKNEYPDIQKLYENVKFKHGSGTMSCDSAYFNSKLNQFEAFGRVVMIDDTVVLKGDYLKYDGKTKMANIRDNITLEDGKVTLYTDFLDYDMNEKIGYYYVFGKIIDDINQLTSKRGVYYQSENRVHFVDSVEVVTPDSFMSSDTLVYHTETEVVEIVCPTDIYGEERSKVVDYAHVLAGTYATRTELLNAHNRVYIRKEFHTLYSDSVYYAKADSTIELYDNIEIYDMENEMWAYGDNAEFYENKESFYISEMPYIKQVSEGDTLYMRGDTIRGITEIVELDTTRIITIDRNVRLFRSDFQAMCDSMSVSTKDSIARMFYTPVLWHDSYQLTADQIDIVSRDNEVKELRMNVNSFICSHVDSVYYNQVSSNNMICYMEDRQMKKLDAKKNAVTIFYPQDSLLVVGLNRIESRDLEFFFAKDRNNKSKLDRMKFLEKPKGVLMPLFNLGESDMKLKPFVWHDDKRPKSKDDIIHFVPDSLVVDEKKDGLENLYNKLHDIELPNGVKIPSKDEIQDGFKSLKKEDVKNAINELKKIDVKKSVDALKKANIIDDNDIENAIDAVKKSRLKDKIDILKKEGVIKEDGVEEAIEAVKSGDVRRGADALKNVDLKRGQNVLNKSNIIKEKNIEKAVDAVKNVDIKKEVENIKNIDIKKNDIQKDSK